MDGGALFFIFHMRTQDLLCQALLWTIFHVVHGIICHQEPRLKSSAPENERKENCVWSQHTRPADQPDVRWVMELLMWIQLTFFEKKTYLVGQHKSMNSLLLVPRLPVKDAS